MLVRWGGEEFLWICPATPMVEAAQLFARVRERLRHQPLVRAGSEVVLTVSMGFSLYPPWPGASAHSALSLRIADAALYRAKACGRDTWAGFTASGSLDASASEPGMQDASVEQLEARGVLTGLGAADACDVGSPARA